MKRGAATDSGTLRFAALSDGHDIVVSRDEVRVVEDTETGMAVTLCDGTTYAVQGDASRYLEQLETSR